MRAALCRNPPARSRTTAAKVRLGLTVFLSCLLPSSPSPAETASRSRQPPARSPEGHQKRTATVYTKRNPALMEPAQTCSTIDSGFTEG